MKPIFITGIGTGIGKTMVAALLAEVLNADYWKPVQAGYEQGTDSLQVASLISNPSTTIHPELYKLQLAASPHIAARQENRRIEISRILDMYRKMDKSQPLIIEGAGGLMVPLNDSDFVFDLIRQLDARLILVSRNYLGSINHSLLTAAFCRTEGLDVAGWIFNDQYMDYEKGNLQLVRLSPHIFHAIAGNGFQGIRLRSRPELSSRGNKLSLFLMINLNYPLLKPVRILLLPISLVYGLIIYFRNWMFDKKILRSATFNLPLICVGNLSVGGTGKSPMVEFLVEKLKQEFRIAILSRGYKRKTRGYTLATSNSTALEIGDEPMQFFNKFPDTTVAVGEERVVAIPQLLHDRPDTEVIILDDAFQHRTVIAGFNILLTDFNNLYTRDWFLPTGDLRDQPKSARRADIIIVTKCAQDFSLAEKNRVIKEIKPDPQQQIFFTAIAYGQPYQIITHASGIPTKTTEVLLVTGIANPVPLKKYLEENFNGYDEIAYSDHHIFTIDDLNQILKKFNQIQSQDKILLTTEKDAVRLQKFSLQLRDLPVFVIPIRSVFLFYEEIRFTRLITTFIRDFPGKA